MFTGTINGIGNLVNFMGHDLENHGNVVLPKINYWEPVNDVPRLSKMHLKRHNKNINNMNEGGINLELNELRKNRPQENLSKLASDSLSKYEKVRNRRRQLRTLINSKNSCFSKESEEVDRRSYILFYE